MKIKTFLFDMGGVVDSFSSAEMERKLLKYFGRGDLTSLSQKWEEYDKYHYKLLRGLISVDVFFKEFEKSTGIIVPEEKDLYIKYFNPVNDKRMVDIIIKLKEAGYRVICGTNVEPPHRIFHEERGDYDIFDKVYASDLLHLAKPDPLFFKAILKEEKTNPKDILFIDDAYENIESAAKLGLNTHHFIDFDEFSKIVNKILKE